MSTFFAITGVVIIASLSITILVFPVTFAYIHTNELVRKRVISLLRDNGQDVYQMAISDITNSLYRYDKESVHEIVNHLRLARINNIDQLQEEIKKYNEINTA